MSLEHEWDRASVDFPLTEESVVFEVGGYIGRWSLEIAKRFNPNLYIFEPQVWAAEQCGENLAKFPKAKIYEYGLGTTNGWFQMGDFETDGCSLVNFPSGRPTCKGRLVSFVEFMRENQIEKIDLLLMNIEGYEFNLIPYMVFNGIMSKIDYFVCQFHLTKHTEEDFTKLVDQINAAKKLRFDYGKTLMGWEPK